MSSLKFQSPVPESVVPLPFRHVLFYLPLQHAPSDIPQYGYLTYMFLSNSLKAFHHYHPQYIKSYGYNDAAGSAVAVLIT